MKKITISQCKQCPFCRDYVCVYRAKGFGQKITNIFSIPEWCPLEDDQPQDEIPTAHMPR